MIKPERVWDSKKRAVRQGKEQVWKVGDDLKTNKGNRWGESDSTKFWVYDNKYRTPLEPLRVYTNKRQDLGPSVIQLSTNIGLTINNSATEGAKTFELDFFDTDSNPVGSVFYEVDSSNNCSFTGFGDNTQLDVEALEPIFGGDNLETVMFNFGIRPMDGFSTQENVIFSMGGIMEETLYNTFQNAIISEDYSELSNVLYTDYRDGAALTTWYPNLSFSFRPYARCQTIKDVDGYYGYLFYDENMGTYRDNYIKINQIGTLNFEWEYHGVFALSYYYKRDNEGQSYENIYTMAYSNDYYDEESQETLSLQDLFKRMFISGSTYNMTGRIDGTIVNDYINPMFSLTKLDNVDNLWRAYKEHYDEILFTRASAAGFDTWTMNNRSEGKIFAAWGSPANYESWGYGMQPSVKFILGTEIDPDTQIENPTIQVKVNGYYPYAGEFESFLNNYGYSDWAMLLDLNNQASEGGINYDVLNYIWTGISQPNTRQDQLSLLETFLNNCVTNQTPIMTWDPSIEQEFNSSVSGLVYADVAQVMSDYWTWYNGGQQGDAPTNDLGNDIFIHIPESSTQATVEWSDPYGYLNYAFIDISGLDIQTSNFRSAYMLE